MKNIKNKVYLLLTILSLLCLPAPVHAYTIETLDRSPDYNEIKETEEALMEKAQYFVTDPSTNLKVEYSRAVKIYTGTNIFEYSNLTPEKIDAMLLESSYVWEVPVEIGKHQYVICTVSRKPPITAETKKVLLDQQLFTEEEMKEQEALVGHWVIPAYYYDESFLDYMETMELFFGETFESKDEKQLYLLGGTPNMLSPFALFQDNSEYKIMTLDQYRDNSSARQSASALQERHLYSFSELKEWCDSQPTGGGVTDEFTGYGTPPPPPQSAAEDSVPYTGLGIAAVLTIALMTLCYHVLLKKYFTP